MIRGFIFLLAIFLGTRGWSYEVDNYTCRFDQGLKDSTQAVNQETNRRLKIAVKKANETVNAQKDLGPGQRCEDSLIHMLLADGIASAWMGNMETWADSAANVSRCKMKMSESIYQDFGVMDSPMAKAAGLGPVIKVNGVHIGTDKLSHFMTEGLNYYEAFKAKGSVKDALIVGSRQELGGYGIRATGIHSYADLAANTQGFQFWKQVTGGDKPYFKCENGVWSQKREFKWEDYVNPAFDESINCNDYKSERMSEKVKNRTARLAAQNGHEQSECPMDKEACKKMNTYFTDPEIYAAVVHADCRNVAHPNARLVSPTSPQQRGQK